MTGGLGPDGPAIFFIGADDGKLQTIIMKRGRWELGDLGGFVDPTPRVGSPLSITPVKEGIMVFFIGEDNALHYLAEDPQTGTWRGKHSIVSVRIPSVLEKADQTHH